MFRKIGKIVLPICEARMENSDTRSKPRKKIDSCG
jgi:uncharacterized Zn finger protein (UPF0148 family)